VKAIGEHLSDPRRAEVADVELKLLRGHHGIADAEPASPRERSEHQEEREGEIPSEAGQPANRLSDPDRQQAAPRHGIVDPERRNFSFINTKSQCNFHRLRAPPAEIERRCDIRHASRSEVKMDVKTMILIALVVLFGGVRVRIEMGPGAGPGPGTGSWRRLLERLLSMRTRAKRDSLPDRDGLRQLGPGEQEDR